MKRAIDFEDLLLKADFSAETDLKDRLRLRLFGKNANKSVSEKAARFNRKTTDAFRKLEEDDLALVSAAGEFVTKIEEQEQADRPSVMPVKKEEI